MAEETLVLHETATNAHMAMEGALGEEEVGLKTLEAGYLPFSKLKGKTKDPIKTHDDAKMLFGLWLQERHDFFQFYSGTKAKVPEVAWWFDDWIHEVETAWVKEEAGQEEEGLPPNEDSLEEHQRWEEMA